MPATSTTNKATKQATNNANANNNNDNRFWQFNNTKMCKFEVLGKCKKGKDCPFAHAGGELRPLPDLHCTKLCKSLILTGICANPNCGYAHSKDELRSTGAFHKTKMCRFMKTGHCALGAKCNFAHCSTELRDAEVDTTPEEGQLLWGGMPLPPGLGMENTASYGAASQKDMPDLSALKTALDMVLLKGDQVADTATEPGSVAKPPGLVHDSPAYIRLSSTPDAVSTVTCQPVKDSSRLGQLNFDYLNADENSVSTRSPPSPPSPPSDTGSGNSSSKTASPSSTGDPLGIHYAECEAAYPNFYTEGLSSNYYQPLPATWEMPTGPCMPSGHWDSSAALGNYSPMGYHPQLAAGQFGQL